MELGIRDKSAIVCASSKGLGKACALHLAEAGCKVIINGRDEEALKATAEEISAVASHDPVIVRADVGTNEGQTALLEACPAPDILINNNGGPPRRDFRELDREAILEGVTQNMVVPIELIQAVLDGMAERGFGRIVNITSLSVYTAIEGLDLSSGARAGLTSFLGGIARGVADRNVTINQILPGKFDTDRLKGGISKSAEARNTSYEEQAKNEASVIPAKRFGNADEFGAIAAFLCSQYAGYITGRNILVDGGLNHNAF